MDEISLGKARIIFIPILLGLIIIFFLKLFSIKISFWILIILLIAMLLVIKPILVPKTSPLTSKLPSIGTTFWVLLVIVILSVAIIWVFDQGPKSRNYLENRTQEGFGDNKSRYVINFDSKEGQARIENERLLIFGEVSIINNDVFYPNPNLEFDILVREGKTAFVEIIFRDVDITREVSCNFTVGHHHLWQTVGFGIDSQDQIWAETFGRDPKNFQISSCSSLNTSKPFNVILKITGDKMENQCSVNIDNVGLGAYS